MINIKKEKGRGIIPSTIFVGAPKKEERSIPSTVKTPPPPKTKK